MAKTSKTEIEFCGKKRRFRRCSNRVLRDSNKDVEALQREATKKRDELVKKISEAQEKRQDAVQLLGLAYKDDTILEKNQKKADKLIKEAKKIESEVEELSNKIGEELATFDERMAEAYDKVCVALLEIEPGEFLENYDSIDLIIAKNLGLFYDLYMSGTPQAKIDVRLRQLIDVEHDNQIGQFRQE
jgi:hypothetical protein